MQKRYRKNSPSSLPLSKRFLARNAHSIEVLECPNHPEAELIEEYHAGDMICSQCGLVVGDRSISPQFPVPRSQIAFDIARRVVDVGSEWRTFSNDKSTKDNSRVGSSEVCTMIWRRASHCNTLSLVVESSSTQGRIVDGDCDRSARRRRRRNGLSQ